MNESASTRITGTQTQKNLRVVGFAHVLATLAPSLYLYPVPYLCTSTYTYTYKHSGIPAILVPRLKRGCTLQVWNGFILPRFPTSRMTKPFWAKATESTFIVGNGSMSGRKGWMWWFSARNLFEISCCYEKGTSEKSPQKTTFKCDIWVYIFCVPKFPSSIQVCFLSSISRGFNSIPMKINPLTKKWEVGYPKNCCICKELTFSNLVILFSKLW